MKIIEIDTPLSSNDIFINFKDDNHTMFLDSSKISESLGKYSIIVSNPRHVYSVKGSDFYKDGQIIGHNPLEDFQEVIDEYQLTYDTSLPFVGGFVGFLGYDLKGHIEKLPVTTVDDINMPDMFFGLYDGAVVVDHMKNKVYITDVEIDDSVNRLESLREKVTTQAKAIELKNHKSPAVIVSNFGKEDYKVSIEKVRNYIKSGDIYQANMTQRFQSELREHPFNLYQKLRVINPAPFSSYIDFGTGHIASSSPERFIQMKNRKLQTRPIKGTMPRYEDPIKDEESKQTLIHSKKDQSELLMIVDLERNDLSRVAKRGSVKVPELFKLETYETVYHLVATVEADVKDKINFMDIIRATFPGGSITGAPKIRAMEVIDELEPTSRGLYTGSIGYIDLNGDFDLNIVIRTFICKDNQAYFQAGGGIVWDSDPESEYHESLQKAKALSKTLNYGV